LDRLAPTAALDPLPELLLHGTDDAELRCLC